MDFSLSDEQQLIQDGLRRLLQKNYGFEQRAGFMRARGGWSPDMWAHYAEMGLLALPFAEEHGGLSGSPVETMIVMEEFGRALTLEPYVASVVMAGGVLRHAGSGIQLRRLTERVIDGSLILALAHEEALAQGDMRRVDTAARRNAEGWALDGEKSFALHGGSADGLIVSARIAGEPGDENGIGLFYVDAQQDGVAVEDYTLHDGQHAAALKFTNVRIAPENVISEPGNGYPILARVCDEAIAAVCAEAVGVMSELHDMTIGYLKQRRQFGVPIGNFQALQHRAADMYIALEQARSMVIYAAMMCTENDSAARAQAISAAKYQIGRSGRFIGEQAVQLHGGIAIAAEYRAGHYFKKLVTLDQFLGDADHHLEALSCGPSRFSYG